MNPADALDIVRRVAAARATDVQTLSLPRAHGRVLAEPVRTPEGAPVTAAVPGQVLTPLRIARAAGAGVEVVRVRRRPTVAVFVVKNADGPAADAAQALVAGLLRADGLEPTVWPALPADARSVEVAIRDAGCAFDAIVVCADAGGRGFVDDVLAAFGDVRVDGLDVDGDADALRFATLDAACVLALPLDPLAITGLHLMLGRALFGALEARSEPRPRVRGRLAAPRRAARAFEWARVDVDERGVATLVPIIDARGAADGPDAVLVPANPTGDAPSDAGAEALPLPPP